MQKYNNKIILVYNLMEDSFEISILKIENEKIDIIGTNKDSKLGAKDITDKLKEIIIDKIYDDENIDLLTQKESGLTQRNYEHNLNKIIDEATKTEIELSEYEDSQISIINLIKNNETLFNIEFNITRKEFEDEFADIRKKFIDIVKDLINNTSIDKSEIDEILMFGDSPSILSIRQSLKDQLGIEPEKSVDDSFLIAQYKAIELMKKNKNNLSIFKKITSIDTLKEVKTEIMEEYEKFIDEFLDYFERVESQLNDKDMQSFTLIEKTIKNRGKRLNSTINKFKMEDSWGVSKIEEEFYFKLQKNLKDIIDSLIPEIAIGIKENDAYNGVLQIFNEFLSKLGIYTKEFKVGEKCDYKLIDPQECDDCSITDKSKEDIIKEIISYPYLIDEDRVITEGKVILWSIKHNGNNMNEVKNESFQFEKLTKQFLETQHRLEIIEKQNKMIMQEVHFIESKFHDLEDRIENYFQQISKQLNKIEFSNHKKIPNDSLKEDEFIFYNNQLRKEINEIKEINENLETLPVKVNKIEKDIQNISENIDNVLLKKNI